MLKRAACGFAVLALPVTASAQWEAAVGYSSMDVDPSYTVGALTAGVGYRVSVTDALSIAPGARIGFGVQDDSAPIFIGIIDDGEPARIVEDADVEVRQFYGVQARADFELGNGIYLLAVPSYSRLEIELSESSGLSSDFHVSNSDWGFGIGVGAGIRLSDLLSAEISYESVDFRSTDVEVLSVQARFRF